MNERMAKALVGGTFGALPGWLIGMEGADFWLGIVRPAIGEMKASKAAGHPGFPPVGKIWHGWTHAHTYLPTHWGSLFSHPHLLMGAGSIGLLTGGFMAYQVSKASGISFWGGPKAAGKGQYGSAHWRNARSLNDSYRKWQAPVSKEKKSSKLQSVEAIREEAEAIRAKWENAGKKGPEPATPPVGLLVGLDSPSAPTSAWILERDEHALILGSTRSGKTRRLILPTIGIIGSTAQESLILTDPKGEIYDHSAKWLESRGYQIIRIDLIRPRPGSSHRYNPLVAVWQALHPENGGQPDYALAAKIARQVAHIITFGQGAMASTEPIWINGQISLTSAMILAVAQRAERVEECHLTSAYRILIEAGAEDDGKALDAFFGGFIPGHPAKLAYSTYQLAQGKTRASIITGAAAGLQLWGDPEIAWATGAQDHTLENIGKRPTAVFLVIPHDDASRYMAAALYVNMLFRALTNLARDTNGRIPIRANCLLDEFGNMPSFPDFDQFVTVSSGMGIRLVLALQNIEQLKKHYESTERTIRGNLGTWLFLRTSDLQTAKELSDMIGRYTLNSESAQMPKVGWLTQSTNVGHTSQGLSLTGRELVTSDELMRWPQGQILAWQAGYPPAKLSLPDLTTWEIFQPIHERIPRDWPDVSVPAVPIFGAAEDAFDEFVKGGDEVKEIIPANEMGDWGDLFFGQAAEIDPNDEPENTPI